MSSPREALSHFQVEGAIHSIEVFGSGHINDSYRVSTDSGDYLLQKINLSVFKNVEALESNLNGLFASKSSILVDHVHTRSGRWLHQEADEVWKLQAFDKQTYAPRVASNPVLVEQVARGFGKFTALSEQLKVDEFSEAIADFHNLDWRLEQLNEAVRHNIADRAREAASLLEVAERYSWIAQRMNGLKSDLPKRVCHNDTKIDNILLSKENDEFRFVIDLDTVGPGYALYDFGDMMRTLLSPTAENEPDQDKIQVRSSYFDALKQGYLQECQNLLTPAEIEHLSFGGLYMTYMMGVRFLTDFLNGDIYYRVSFDDENFVRARNQFVLLGHMESLPDLSVGTNI